MQLHHCPDCGLTQLGYTVDPKIVYRNFPFVSGTTQHRDPAPPGARAATRRGDAAREGLVRRRHRLERRHAAQGISALWRAVPRRRPCRRPRADRERAGHPARCTRSSTRKSAAQIRADHGPADAISAAGVFGHIADLGGVMRGVQTLLAPGGRLRSPTTSTGWTWWSGCTTTTCSTSTCATTPSSPCSGSTTSTGSTCSTSSRSDVHGGSIRCSAAGRAPVRSRSECANLLAVEQAEGLYDEATWSRFAEAVEQRRRDLFDAVYTRQPAARRSSASALLRRRPRSATTVGSGRIWSRTSLR